MNKWYKNSFDDSAFEGLNLAMESRSSKGNREGLEGHRGDGAEGVSVVTQGGLVYFVS